MKQIPEFNIEIQPILESSWLARFFSSKSAREWDHFKWQEETSYFNQVINYIFLANYTERDFTNECKTIIEPLLRQYSIDSGTIKAILQGKPSLPNVKSKIFAIIDPHYASHIFKPVFKRLSTIHQYIVKNKNRRKSSEEVEILAEEDEAIANYNLNGCEQIDALLKPLKHHDNHSMLEISRDLLSQLSRSLHRAEAIAYSRRPFWFLRWLFTKRETQYQTRMKLIKARRRSLNEVKEGFVMIKYKRLNQHLIDNSLSKEQFNHFKKDIE